jgi:hypothetical protein
MVGFENFLEGGCPLRSYPIWMIALGKIMKCFADATRGFRACYPKNKVVVFWCHDTALLHAKNKWIYRGKRNIYNTSLHQTLQLFRIIQTLACATICMRLMLIELVSLI